MITDVLFQKIRVLFSRRRLKRKVKVSFYREFSGMYAFKCVSKIAVLIILLQLETSLHYKYCYNILMNMALWSQGRELN